MKWRNRSMRGEAARDNASHRKAQSSSLISMTLLATLPILIQTTIILVSSIGANFRFDACWTVTPIISCAFFSAPSLMTSALCVCVVWRRTIRSVLAAPAPARVPARAVQRTFTGIEGVHATRFPGDSRGARKFKHHAIETVNDVSPFSARTGGLLDVSVPLKRSIYTRFLYAISDRMRLAPRRRISTLGHFITTFRATDSSVELHGCRHYTKPASYIMF